MYALVLWIPVRGHHVCPHPGVWGAVAFSKDGDIDHPWPAGTKTKVWCS